MEFNFDTITGREMTAQEEYDYRGCKNVYQIEQEQKLKKYECAGIYCICIDNKILYIGESVNMRQRISQHIKKICGATLAAQKLYRVLKEAKQNGHDIQFHILAHTTKKTRDGAMRELVKLEAEYINYYFPPLNTQIPTLRGKYKKRESNIIKVENFQDALALAKDYEDTIKKGVA